jgi:hypothetical protein
VGPGTWVGATHVSCQTDWQQQRPTGRLTGRACVQAWGTTCGYFMVTDDKIRVPSLMAAAVASKFGWETGGPLSCTACRLQRQHGYGSSSKRASYPLMTRSPKGFNCYERPCHPPSGMQSDAGHCGCDLGCMHQCTEIVGGMRPCPRTL